MALAVDVGIIVGDGVMVPVRLADAVMVCVAVREGVLVLLGVVLRDAVSVRVALRDGVAVMLATSVFDARRGRVRGSPRRVYAEMIFSQQFELAARYIIPRNVAAPMVLMGCWSSCRR